jgi:succinyl-CoA synthetase beta subunit
MRLLEFQAKRIFAEYKIPVPEHALMEGPDDTSRIHFPVMLKAQVPAGKRGKAGGIQRAADAGEAAMIVETLLETEINGFPVQAVLAEAYVEVVREMYLSLLMDREAGQPLLVASGVGGVDIEEIAESHPEQIVKQRVDPCLGILPYMVRFIASALEIEDPAAVGGVMSGMYSIFEEEDATLVEINPLAQTDRGLIALDAKVVLDDKASFRHRDLHAVLRREQQRLVRTESSAAEALAREKDITYVLLDGNVGLIADGAGTGMAAVDLIKDAGGSPANFCEMGGLADARTIEESMGVVLANPRVQSLLITLIGGLTRMDHMGEGIARYVRTRDLNVPLVVRMCGTKEEVGKRLLREAGLQALDDLQQAVEQAVELARGYDGHTG